MRIAFDLQGAQNGSRDRGIGRYVSAFSKALISNRGEHEIILILNALFPDHCASVLEAFGPLPERCSFAVFHGIGPTFEHDNTNHWRLRVSELMYRKFISDLSIDVLITGSVIEGFHDNTITGVGTAPVNAAILYDLIPLINPSDHLRAKEAKLWYYRRLKQVEKADILLSISESSRQEAITHLGFPENRIVNIKAAASDNFLNLDLQERKNGVRSREMLHSHGISRPYIMHTSAFDKRKNFDGLIRAYAALPRAVRSQYQLLLVCKIGDKDRAAMRQLTSSLKLSDNDVVFPGYVSDDDLITYYANCTLFAFPSFHEGFGLPILEAMHCGAPVVGSNVSSVPEVIGNESALFDPTSIADMATCLERFLTDPKALTELRQHSAAQAKEFDWGATARLALQAIEQVTQARTYPSRTNVGLTETVVAISHILRPPQWDQRQLAAAALALAKNEEVTAQF